MHKGLNCRGRGDLCALRPALEGPGMLNTQFLEGKECRTCYLPRRLKADVDVRSNLVTFALSLWPETMLDPPQTHTIVFPVNL